MKTTMLTILAALAAGLGTARAEVAKEGTAFNPEIDAQAKADLEARLQREYEAAAQSGKLDGNHVAAGREGKGERGGQPSREEVMKQFDKDGNGELDAKEKEAVMAAFLLRVKNDPELQEKILERYDLNKNGTLDENEKGQVESDLRMRAEFGKKVQEHALKRFDADGDGKLDEAERAKFEESRKKFETYLHDQALKKFDADGDGKLSREEETRAREDFIQKLRQGQNGPRRQR
ncbi:MAG: EF-hand domain-containing protein [Planctomycetota bacterium]|nr:EF-hand domain-containing protein [Planctomycetota bacterium]